LVATGVNVQEGAQPANAIDLLMALDECVAHPDGSAKDIAFFKMSRSSVTLLSSALRRRNCSVCDAAPAIVQEKSAAP
jgi:hypothetical protein